jgi:hypothetical protein
MQPTKHWSENGAKNAEKIRLQIFTSDSSGQRELPKAARPRGVVPYNLVSSFHSRNFLWHNHLSESCADFTTSLNGFVELRRVHLT